MALAHDMDPHDMVVRIAPHLQGWYDQRDDYRDSPWSYYSLLAREVMKLADADVIPTLAALAPAIEQLLVDYDEGDAVSLGFVEDLQALVEGRGLDARRVHQALGPIARGAWDSLYHYRHQGHYYEIDFTERHVAGPVRSPARLERWLAGNGAHVAAAEPIAYVRIGDDTYELVVTFGCHLGRRAVEDGHALPVGCMLLHVLPEIDAHIKPAAPYARLVSVAPLQAVPESAPHVVV